MRPKSVLCARHGETVAKAAGITQGQSDSPLTARGRRQAHELANSLGAERFDVILSSPLGRALQTAAILSARLRIADTRTCAYFMEQKEGAFEGLTRAQQRARHPECFEPGTGRILYDRIPRAEPIDDFLARVAAGLREIEGLDEATSVLVVTHAGVLQALSSLVNDEDFIKVSANRIFGFCDVFRFSSSDIPAP